MNEGQALQKAANNIISNNTVLKSAGPKQEKQSSNAKKQDDNRNELERWKKFVTDNKLAFKDNKGDAYLKVEAWNYLFAMKGVMATIVDMSRYPGEKTLYIAKAALAPLSKEIPAEGIPLGATAFGACEVGEGIFQDNFSALSMAQTRAVGKLGRTVYAHLAIACGYKATPLEEMVFDKDKK